MKLDLGFLYISIGRDGFHIEIDKHPYVWLVLSFTNKLGFDELEESLKTENERWESLPT